MKATTLAGNFSKLAAPEMAGKTAGAGAAEWAEDGPGVAEWVVAEAWVAGEHRAAARANPTTRIAHIFSNRQRRRCGNRTAEIDVADDDDHKFVFYTDGRKVEKSKIPPIRTLRQWEEYRLVAEEKIRTATNTSVLMKSCKATNNCAKPSS
jgi:hypothetical protein